MALLLVSVILPFILSDFRIFQFTIALTYIAGRLVPLAPYFLIRSVYSALIGSVIVTLLAFLVFGYIKGRFTTTQPFRSAWQTVVVGGLAATAAFVIANAFG